MQAENLLDEFDGLSESARLEFLRGLSRRDLVAVQLGEAAKTLANVSALSGATVPHCSERRRFESLRNRWKTYRAEHSTSSCLTDLFMAEPYQQIVGMGPAVLPFLLEELRSDPSGDWFWALRAITQHDPVPPESRGQIPAMREVWLRWLERNATTS
jgi:hypothetical protein